MYFLLHIEIKVSTHQKTHNNRFERIKKSLCRMDFFWLIFKVVTYRVFGIFKPVSLRAHEQLIWNFVLGLCFQIKLNENKRCIIKRLQLLLLLFFVTDLVLIRISSFFFFLCWVDFKNIRKDFWVHICCLSIST